MTLRDRYPELIPGDTAAQLEGSLAKAADRDLSSLVAAGLWSELVEMLTDATLLLPDRRIGELIPGLVAWSECGLTDASVLQIIRPLSRRTLNCLQRNNKKTWGSIAQSTLQALLWLKNFGIGSAIDLVDACIRLGAHDRSNDSFVSGTENSLLGRRQDSRAGVLWEWLEYRRLQRSTGELSSEAARSVPAIGGAASGNSAEVQKAANVLRLVAEWAGLEKGADRMGSVLQVSPEAGSMPDDLVQSWDQFAGINPLALVADDFSHADVNQMIDDVLDTFDQRQRAILENRVLAVNQRTLAELAEEIGVTSRERVRQIQVKVKKRLKNILALPRFRLLRWRASTLRSSLGRMSPTAGKTSVDAIAWALRGANTESRPILRGLLLTLAGYEERNGWLVWIDSAELDPKELEAMVDENGLLPFETASKWLSDNGVAPSVHEIWLERQARFRRFGPALALWSGSIVDKCVSLLAIRGAPTDAETLVTEVGEAHNVTGARNRFFEDPRLSRVSRSLWALKAWGMEEYSTITEEISQRIDEAGGRVLLSVVVDELRVFGVKESSIKVYAEAPMFVIENGWIRQRATDETFVTTQSIANSPGAYQSSESVISVVIAVDQGALRGSGRRFDPAVAARLGVLPDQHRVFDAGTAQVNLTWPMTAAFGPSLGSIRVLAAQAKAEEGDSLRLDFDLEHSTVSATRIANAELMALDPLTSLRLLTGIAAIDHDPLAHLSLALQVPRGAVRGVLVQRGDRLVADLIPMEESDPELDQALTELIEVLNRSA